MRTANPALKDTTFARVSPAALGAARTMTLDGAVNKTLLLVLLTVTAATFTWREAMVGSPTLPLWTWLGAFGGMGAAFVTIFRNQWAPVTAPLYAALEGLFLGGFSAMLDRAYPGIVPQAVALTVGALFCLLLAYRSGLIRASENFKLGITAATGAIALIYLAGFVMSLFGAEMPLLHESSLMGIGFSLFVVAVAALNLVLDFDFIEQGSEMGLPAYMEWYAGFGLLITLVWLYIEFLRLLLKLNSRRS
jgi:uncharacterized YccA/Bax inhibitor family protein